METLKLFPVLNTLRSRLVPVIRILLSVQNVVPDLLYKEETYGAPKANLVCGNSLI